MVLVLVMVLGVAIAVGVAVVDGQKAVGQARWGRRMCDRWYAGEGCAMVSRMRRVLDSEGMRPLDSRCVQSKVEALHPTCVKPRIRTDSSSP